MKLEGLESEAGVRSPVIADNIYIYVNESGVIVAGDVNK